MTSARPGGCPVMLPHEATSSSEGVPKDAPEEAEEEAEAEAGTGGREGPSDAGAWAGGPSSSDVEAAEAAGVLRNSSMNR